METGSAGKMQEAFFNGRMRLSLARDAVAGTLRQVQEAPHLEVRENGVWTVWHDFREVSERDEATGRVRTVLEGEVRSDLAGVLTVETLEPLLSVEGGRPYAGVVRITSSDGGMLTLTFHEGARASRWTRTTTG